MGASQVGEDAHQHEALVDGLQVLVVPRRGRVERGEDLAAASGVELGTPVEHVQVAGRVGDRAHQEVAWHPDADEGYAATPAHLDGHHGQGDRDAEPAIRSEEHTSDLQSLMRISYAV